MSELEIPDAALRCLYAIDPDWDGWDSDVDARLVVQTIAARVVAAELRRFVNEDGPSIWADPMGQWTADQAAAARAMKAMLLDRLLRRADELDGGA